MPAFRSPFGDVIVEVAEGNEAAYLAAGWPLVGAVAEAAPVVDVEPKRRGRPPQSK